MKEVRKILLKALGEAQAFKMVDTNPVDLEAELKAAKETGAQLEKTIKQAIESCKARQVGKARPILVLSVEGPAFMDKGTWATHKALAIGSTEEELIAKIKSGELNVQPDDETCFLITNLVSGYAWRAELD
jgi:hypothetical protein